MAQERLAPHMIMEVLHLRLGKGLPLRVAASAGGVSVGAASGYCRRALAQGLGWPLPEGMDEAALLRALFPPVAVSPRVSREALDCEGIHRELQRKGVTLQLLWQEYQERVPGGYKYSQFCELYRRWRGRQKVSMRQVHRAGEKMFVDYAGPTVRYFDRDAGKICEGQLFVAVLGASNYTYAEVTASQRQDDWIGSHVRAYEFFGGVPDLTVPDNLKGAVTHPCRYEPELNRTYQALGRHYGTVMLPARPSKPQDKAKVEVGVQVAERWILAVLRNRKFFSLAEINQAVRELLAKLNRRPMRTHAGRSREELFLEVDKPVMKPLPAAPYEHAEFRRATVNIDYHVVVEGNLYSVPYSLVRQPVDVRLTARTVEIISKYQRVAAHARLPPGTGRVSTIAEHRPKSHQAHAEWTPSRMIEWAGSIGEACRGVVKRILEDRPHPESGYRACLGIIRLAKGYGTARMEAACRRALACSTCSYQSINSILKHGLDMHPLPNPAAMIPPPPNATVRGACYYQ